MRCRCGVWPALACGVAFRKLTISVTKARNSAGHCPCSKDRKAESTKHLDRCRPRPHRSSSASGLWVTQTRLCVSNPRAFLPPRPGARGVSTRAARDGPSPNPAERVGRRNQCHVTAGRATALHLIQKALDIRVSRRRALAIHPAFHMPRQSFAGCHPRLGRGTPRGRGHELRKGLLRSQTFQFRDGTDRQAAQPQRARDEAHIAGIDRLHETHVLHVGETRCHRLIKMRVVSLGVTITPSRSSNRKPS